MSNHKIFVARFLVVFVLCTSLLAEDKTDKKEQDNDKDKREVHVQVERTSLLEASTDRLVIGVTLAVTAKQNVTLEQIVLADLHVNGMPLYAAPLQGKLELHANQLLELPDPLRVTVYLRDLDSVAPLKQALTDGRMTVEGGGYVTVHLGVLSKMAMLASRVEVPVAVHEEVPFDIPGGVIIRTAALKTLDGVDFALRGVNTAVAAGAQRFSAFRKEVAQSYAQYVMYVYVRYELRDADGVATTMEWSGVGLRYSANRLLVPKEALQPWKFDPEIAAAIRGKELSLVPASYDLWAWPSSAQITSGGKFNFDAALRYTKQQATLLYAPADETTTMVGMNSSGHAFKVQVDRRNAASNLAVLGISPADDPSSAAKIPDVKSEDLKIADLASPAAPAKWDKVAVFRFRASQNGGGLPEVIFVPCTNAGDSMQLGEQVDRAAYGSPIVSPEGVIGIVQDHDGGVSWAKAASALKLSQIKQSEMN